MKAKLTRDFEFYVNGIVPTMFTEGTVLEDDAAACAVQVGAAVEVGEDQPSQEEQEGSTADDAQPPAAPTKMMSRLKNKAVR